MELVKITLDSKNIDGSQINITNREDSGVVEFNYKDVCYYTDIDSLSLEEKEGFLKKNQLITNKPIEWSNDDYILLVFSDSWICNLEEVLIEYPHLWELDEERMWNDNNTLSLANNTIQFKKPFDLFAGLEEFIPLIVRTDGQNTNGEIVVKGVFFKEECVDIKKWIESKGEGKEITEVNHFEFVGSRKENQIVFLFEGLKVVFKEEIPNPYPNNCALCSDFVDAFDLYCLVCTQIED